MTGNTLSNSLRLGFIGAGNMAQSLIGGLIANGFPKQNLYVSDPSPNSQTAASALGATICETNDGLVSSVDILVLAVKPQIMKPVLVELAPTYSKYAPLTISIAAGINCQALSNWLNCDAPVVRCMPNTPALLQRGATALYANKAVSSEQRDNAKAILEAVGIALWVEEESMIDAVTALSGSGPAYFFLLMELMQQTAQKLGLDSEVAKQLTLQTALGAAEMACNADVDATELRKRVTSPNGTTHAAVESFLDSGLASIVEKALTAASDRSVELANELGN